MPIPVLGDRNAQNAGYGESEVDPGVAGPIARIRPVSTSQRNKTSKAQEGDTKPEPRISPGPVTVLCACQSRSRSQSGMRNHPVPLGCMREGSESDGEVLMAEPGEQLGLVSDCCLHPASGRTPLFALGTAAGLG